MTEIEKVEITRENALKVDIQQLATIKRSGSLIFDEVGQKLLQVQTWMNEVQDLDLKVLTPEDVNYLRSKLKQLAEHLEWMRVFDPGVVTNAKEEKEGFDRRVMDFYNDVYKQVAKGLLPFLHDEQRKLNPDQVKITEELKTISKLRSDLENELQTIRSETERIREVKQETAVAKGERATVKIGTHFNSEVKRYELRAKNWFWIAVAGYACILIFLIKFAFNTLGYIDLLKDPEQTINNAVVWSALISKLVILGAIWYGLHFIVKNYNVNSHLSAVNRHRAAIAGTLEDFIAFEEQKDEPKTSEVLTKATDAMFKNVAVGYVTKTEKESANPILQIINDLTGARSGQQ